MENYIQINNKQINLDPTNNDEFNDVINTCNYILGVMVIIATQDKTSEKERAEAIMKMAGKIGGDIARKALVTLANEKAEQNPPEETKDA